jgi:tRNA 2-thiouridine synthesizing protein D
MPLRYTLIIQAAPYAPQSQGAYAALAFCKALLAKQHQVTRLFFYGDGVHNLNSLMTPPQDEIALPTAWRALIETHSIDAVVCIAAAVRRGVFDADEAKRHHKPGANLVAGSLGGLGLLFEAIQASDRCLTFN